MCEKQDDMARRMEVAQARLDGYSEGYDAGRGDAVLEIARAGTTFEKLVKFAKQLAKKLPPPPVEEEE